MKVINFRNIVRVSLAYALISGFAFGSTSSTIIGLDDNAKSVNLQSKLICAYPETALRLGVNSPDNADNTWDVNFSSSRKSFSDFNSSQQTIIRSKPGYVFVILPDEYEKASVAIRDSSGNQIDSIEIVNPKYNSSSCDWMTEINISKRMAHFESEKQVPDLGENELEHSSSRYTGPYNGTCSVGDRYTDYYPQGASAYQDSSSGEWIVTGCFI